jgi:hypothetical protein
MTRLAFAQVPPTFCKLLNWVWVPMLEMTCHSKTPRVLFMTTKKGWLLACVTCDGNLGGFTNYWRKASMRSTKRRTSACVLGMLELKPGAYGQELSTSGTHLSKNSRFGLTGIQPTVPVEIFGIARTRSEKLIDAPRAVHGLCDERLPGFAAQGLDDLAEEAPPLPVVAAGLGGMDNIGKCKIGSGATDNGVRSGVSMPLDGATICLRRLSRVALFISERVQYRKGYIRRFSGKNSLLMRKTS